MHKGSRNSDLDSATGASTPAFRLAWPPLSYCFGLGLVHSWIFLVLLGRALNRSGGDTGPWPLADWALILAASVLTWLATGLAAPRTPMPINRLAVMAPLMSVGTLLIASQAGQYTQTVTWLLFISGPVLAGVGSGWIILAWGELYGALGARRAGTGTSTAVLIGGLLSLAIRQIPSQPVIIGIIGMMPIFSALLLLWARHKYPLPSTPPHPLDHRLKADLIRLGPVLGVCGLSFGLLGGITFGSITTSVRNGFDALTVIGAFVLLCRIVFLHKNLDLASFTYRPVLIVMALGFVLLPPLGVAGIASALVFMGVRMFDLSAWATLSDVSFRFGGSASKIFALGRSAIYSGVIAGLIISSWLLQSTEFNRDQLGLIVLGMLFLLILTASLVLRGSPEWAIGKNIDEQAAIPTQSARLHELAQKYSLSEREREVLDLLAQGRNVPYIREALVISDHTARFHVRSIYAKLDVHSRQQLLDLVEQCETPADHTNTFVDK